MYKIILNISHKYNFLLISLSEVDENENDEDEPPFMDNFDNLWKFACKIRNGEHLTEWRQQFGFIPGKEEKLTQQFNCHIEGCQFKAIFLKVELFLPLCF
jgi:hypothetical protein